MLHAGTQPRYHHSSLRCGSTSKYARTPTPITRSSPFALEDASTRRGWLMRWSSSQRHMRCSVPNSLRSDGEPQLVFDRAATAVEFEFLETDASDKLTEATQRPFKLQEGPLLAGRTVQHAQRLGPGAGHTPHYPGPCISGDLAQRTDRSLFGCRNAAALVPTILPTFRPVSTSVWPRRPRPSKVSGLDNLANAKLTLDLPRGACPACRKQRTVPASHGVKSNLLSRGAFAILPRVGFNAIPYLFGRLRGVAARVLRH